MFYQCPLFSLRRLSFLIYCFSFILLTALQAAKAESKCPVEMAESELSCIDKWEAHLVYQQESGEWTQWSPFHPPIGQEKYTARSAAHTIPQASINAVVAQRACQRAGKRLCTENEWMAGCQGPKHVIYPYGMSYRRGACNEARSTHPLIDLYGGDFDWIWTPSAMNNPLINQQEQTVARTGEYANCQSATGSFDQVGNLHEWVADKTNKGTGIFKGGYYVDAKINGEGCFYRTTAHGQNYHDYSTGFRCCRDL